MHGRSCAAPHLPGVCIQHGLRAHTTRMALITSEKLQKKTNRKQSQAGPLLQICTNTAQHCTQQRRRKQQLHALQKNRSCTLPQQHSNACKLLLSSHSEHWRGTRRLTDLLPDATLEDNKSTAPTLAKQFRLLTLHCSEQQHRAQPAHTENAAVLQSDVSSCKL